MRSLPERWPEHLANGRLGRWAKIEGPATAPQKVLAEKQRLASWAANLRRHQVGFHFPVAILLQAYRHKLVAWLSEGVGPPCPDAVDR